MKILIFLLLLMLSKPGFSQVTIIYDSLAGGKNISGTVAGGTFNSEGYQPGTGIENQNHILYDVPYMFKEGYIEFEICGMEKPSNVDYDPAFCAIYDGRGITEPIRYTNDFRQNYYRWNIHFRGDLSVFKSKIQMAPKTKVMELRDKPVFTNVTGSYSDEAECVAEPNGQATTWIKDKWYKIRVEWKDKKYAVYLDGIEMWAVTLNCDYTPCDMKIWLGCAPGKNGKYTATIPGLTFRNFKLFSYSRPTGLD